MIETHMGNCLLFAGIYSDRERHNVNILKILKLNQMIRKCLKIIIHKGNFTKLTKFWGKKSDIVQF